MKEPTLTNRDHSNMDEFLALVLDRYKIGEMTREAAVGTLAHVIAAVDQGNYHEARRWFEEGQNYLDETQ